MSKNPKSYPADCGLSASRHHQGSTLPKITSLEPKPVPRTGAVKVAPTPTIHGAGVKRAKP
jgi:hypothetical protein